MAWTFTTSGAATERAGANVSDTIKADEAALNKFSDHAEGRIESESRRSWRENWGSVASGAQVLIGDIASALVAMDMINFDMSGYTSRQEAGTMLDVLDDRANKGLKILKDFKSNDMQTP